MDIHSAKKNYIHPTLACLQSILVEEVFMKLMERPSVTEMDIGGVFEIYRQTKCQKNKMPLKWTKLNDIF